MLNKLFRPKWQHDNPQIRKAAIAKLSSADADTLKTLALTDEQSDIRQLAISKIERLEQLEDIAANTKTRADKDFAHQCWVSRLQESKTRHDLEQWILDCKDETHLLRIIAFTQDDNLGELAISGMNNEAHLLELLQQNKNAKVWRSIVTKLQSEASLKQALETIKGKDKKTQQLLKSRLNEIHQASAEQQARQDQAQQLAQKLNKLLEHPENPQFEGILLSTQQHWQQLKDQLSSDDVTQIEALLTQCQQTLDNARQAEAEAAAKAEKVQQDSSARNALLEQVQTLASQTLSIEQQSTLNEIQTQWQALNADTPSNNQALFEKRCQQAQAQLDALQRLQDKQETISKALQGSDKDAYGPLLQQLKRLKQIQKEIQWPDKAPQPQLLQQVHNGLEHCQQQLKQLDQQAGKLTQDIKQWIQDADKLIEKDELKQAKQLAQKIRPALNKLPEQKSKTFGPAFQRISNAVRALEDWKDYATDPKRDELCEQMQKLIDTDIPAPNKADAIKQLQKDWKALGYCHNQDAWKRFQALADEAYLPCKAFYADQKKQRAYNAEQRIIICEQLENFITQQDWAHCDWKALEKLHRATQEEWKRFSPVAKEQHKPLQDRYYVALNQIRDKLNEERQRNTDAMQTLIETAKALSEQENTQEAIDQYQALHEEWKKLGISFHKKQHQLWQAFTDAGEALYKQRRSHHQAADDERQNNLKNAESLCQSIEQLSQRTDTELGPLRSDLEQLKTDFTQIDNLPRNSVKALKQRYQNACKAFDQALKQQQQQAWLARFDTLQTEAQAWQQAELEGQSCSADLLSQDFPDSWKQAISQRFNTKISTALETQARHTCIAIEVLADIESPGEDKALRMELQMQKLTAGLGQATQGSLKDQVEQLYLQWFAIPCWDKDTHHKLQERFLSSAKQALAQ